MLGRPEGLTGPVARYSPPPPEAGRAHVWVGDLAEPWDWEALHDGLSEEERTRARGFRFESDRKRFVLGRGMLRGLLGHYLGIARTEVELQQKRRDPPGFSHREG